MRITQGTFSYLPDFTDEEIAAQVRYSVANGWALAVEYTDDPHPRNVYWEMWGLPYFDIHDVEAVTTTSGSPLTTPSSAARRPPWPSSSTAPRKSPGSASPAPRAPAAPWPTRWGPTPPTRPTTAATTATTPEDAGGDP